MAMSPDSEITTSGQPIALFPTICYVAEHGGVEQLNQDLEKFCLEQEAAQPGLETSSILGGYHSDRSFFENDNATVQQLKQLLIGNTRNYLAEYWKQESTLPLAELTDLELRMTGWSVILRSGNISTPHTHPGAHLSGVYYVTTNEEAQRSQRGAGNLALVDPRIRASVAPIRNQKSNAMFAPKSGLVIMFPSFLEHFVLPFQGDGLRISIAFNITLSPGALQQN